MRMPAVFVSPSTIRDYSDSQYGSSGWVEQAEGLTWSRRNADRAATLLTAIDALDPALVAEGLKTAKTAFKWTRAVAAVCYRLTVWEGGHDDDMPLWPVGTIYKLLATFPEQPAPRTLTRLPFIRDPQLRRSIARDIDSLDGLLRSSEWKAVTVIGGSIVEALLLDSLLRRRKRAASEIRVRVTARDPLWPRTVPPVDRLTSAQMLVIAQAQRRDKWPSSC